MNDALVTVNLNAVTCLLSQKQTKTKTITIIQIGHPYVYLHILFGSYDAGYIVFFSLKVLSTNMCI